MDTYCSPAARARYHDHDDDNVDSYNKLYVLNASSIVKLSIAVCMLPFSLHVLSRDWWWPQAWFIIICQWFTICIAGQYLWTHRRSLLKERETFIRHSNTAAFDRVLAPSAVAITPFMYLAAGLQHKTLQPWDTKFSNLHAAAALVVLFSLFLQSWAICTNHWFSSVVRIQTDRNHRVCSSGPYAYVRHPAYTAATLQGLGEAVLLTSSWCFVLAAVRGALLVIRTVFEDSYLQQRLTGYAEYTQKVRYRLIPGLW